MKKIVVLFVLLATAVSFTSCGGNDGPNKPKITHAHGTEKNPDLLSLQETFPFKFDVVAEAGYANHVITADVGVIEPGIGFVPIGKENFSIEGIYQAPNFADNDKITLTVTDQKGKTTSSTIYVVIEN